MKKGGTKLKDQIAFIKLSVDQFLKTGASVQKGEKKALRIAGEHGSLLDQFNDVIFILDNTGQFVFVNKSSQRRTSIPTEKFIGRHFLQLIERQNHEFAQNAFQKLSAGEEIPSLEIMRQTASGESITVELRLSTIYEDNTAIAFLGIFRDVTHRQQAREALKKARDELEIRVRERTTSLQKAKELLNREIKDRKMAERRLKNKEKQLQLKTKNLEELNTAFRVLLKQRQEDKIELEEKVVSNFKELIEPYLKKLQRTRLTNRQNAYLNILESNLKEVVSPFSRSLFAKFMNLTHSEIQIANLVKHGMTTKEISEMLDLSTKTVEFHRYNIREKIGIKNKKVNLSSYLSSLQKPLYKDSISPVIIKG